MAGAAFLVAAAVSVLVVAWAVTALLEPDSPIDLAVTFGVVVVTDVAATVLVAGLAGVLRPGPLLALHGLQAALAVALLWRRDLWRPDLWRPDLWRRGRRVQSLPVLPRGARLRHPWTIALLLLAAAALTWQVLVAAVLPSFAFDALTYHLTTVATWVQRGDLAPTPLSLCCARYPAGPELVIAWPAVLLGGDRLVGTVQIGFAVLGAVAVAGIGRGSGLSRPGAAAAGALFAMTPAVLAQAPTDYVDVVLGALVLAALHGLARYAATADPRRLVVAGLAAGTVLGTKGIGVLWAGVLVLASIGVVAAHARRGRVPGRAAVLACAAMAVPCLAVGGWWYLRNAVQTGNPLYPLALQVGGVRLLDGPTGLSDVVQEPPTGADAPWPVAVVLSWAADLDFWNQGSYDYQQRLGGLGPLWPWLGLPLLAPFVLALARARCPALLVPALVAAVFLVQPFRWWARFTLPLAAVGALAVVAAAEWARRRWWRRTVRTAALLLAGAGVLLSSYAVDPAARADPLPAARVLGLIGAPTSERSLGRLFHPEYAFLERVPADATVVVDLAAPSIRFVSPLFGPDYRRTVLPGTAGPPPPGAWIVTARGRDLDRTLTRDARFTLDSDVREVRVWRPTVRPLG